MLRTPHCASHRTHVVASVETGIGAFDDTPYNNKATFFINGAQSISVGTNANVYDTNRFYCYVGGGDLAPNNNVTTYFRGLMAEFGEPPALRLSKAIRFFFPESSLIE